MIVIKIGGSILENVIENENFYNILKNIDDEIIIVHGGGNYLDNHSEILNYEKKYVTSPEGIRSRYTDKKTLELFTMVMNLISNKIVLNLRRAGLKAVSINGIINARRKEKLIIINEKGRKMVIDGGYTGKITDVDIAPLKNILDSGYIPVISPIAYCNESYLNVDADRAAAYVAGYMGADALMLLTNVNGLYINNKIIEKADETYIKSIMKDVGHGMDKKLMAATEALDYGVKKVIISNPFNDIYNGTVIYNEL